MDLLAKWRKASHATSNVAETISDLRLVNSSLSSVDGAFRVLPYIDTFGVVTVNGVPTRTVEREIRRGNLRNALSGMRVSNTLSAAQESSFKSLIRNQTPDIFVDSIQTRASAARTANPDVAIPARTTGAELEASLTPAGKAKVENAWTKIVEASKGAVVTGVFVGFGVVVAATLWDQLNAATKARNGCYLVQTVNNKTTACKITGRSCGSSDLSTGVTACASAILGTLGYNAYLAGRQSLTNTALATRITTEVGVTLTDSNTNPLSLTGQQLSDLNSLANSLTASDFSTDICTLANKTSGCVGCDPSAGLGTPEYCAAEGLAANYTIQCVTNSTIADTLVEAATAAGTSVLDSITGSLSGASGGSGSIRTIAIWAAVIVVVAIVLAVVIRLLQSSRSRSVQAAPGGGGVFT